MRSWLEQAGGSILYRENVLFSLLIGIMTGCACPSNASSLRSPKFAGCDIDPPLCEAPAQALRVLELAIEFHAAAPDAVLDRPP
jgi:hypothetical protein